MATWTDDYTRSRQIGSVPFTLDSTIGRKDGSDRVKTTSMTVSGTPSLLPSEPLGRRSYIEVTNIGAVDVAIVTTSTGVASDGILVSASGGVWSDSVSASLYIVSTGADSEVRVYERAKSPIN
jgi:hypothetical protein